MSIKPKRVEGFVEIPNAQIIYKNFAGRERPPYNPEGYRNFCVVIEDEGMAKQLSDDGWNVKIRQPKDGEGDPKLYLPVKIGYNVRPPHVIMVSAEGRETELGEDDLEILDEVDIRCGDVAVNPYNWEMRGEYGVAAYLKFGKFYLERTPFADKYTEELPEDLD